jgi:hypothetical protein
MIKLVRLSKKDFEPDRSYWEKGTGMILTGRQLSAMCGSEDRLMVFPFETVEEKYNGLQNGQGTNRSNGTDNAIPEGRE